MFITLIAPKLLFIAAVSAHGRDAHTLKMPGVYYSEMWSAERMRLRKLKQHK